MEDRHIELGRRLFAAYLSQHLGIGLQYAYKKYVSEQVGTYWYQLAEMVDKDMLASIDRQLRSVMDSEKGPVN